VKKIIPRHVHYTNEIMPSGGNVPLGNIPPLDWTRMAFDSWNAFVTGISVTAQQIVDTIGSVIKSIYDAGAVAWANLATAVQTTINNAAAWIGTVLEQIKTAGAVAWTHLAATLQTTINNAAAWIGTILETIKTAGNVAWTSLALAVQTTINNAGAWIGTIIEQIKTAGAVAWNHLATTLQTTINNAAAWIGTVIETIKTAGNVAWTVLATAVQTTINNAGAWIGTIIETIKNAGAVAWSQITKTAQNIMDTLVSWANMVTIWGNIAWTQITKTAQNILDTLGSISQAAIKTLLTSWAWMSNAVSGLGKMTYTYITGTFAAFKATITDAISWAWSEVTKTATDVLNTIASWANMVSSFGNLAWSYVTKTASDIMTTIGTWANILTQVGAQTAAQITTTLTNWATVISGLGSLAWSYVTKTAQNVLDTLGAITSAQIKALLTGWGQISDATYGLGKMAYSYITGTFATFKATITDAISWAWSEVAKTYTDICNTLGSWANVVSSTLGKLTLGTTQFLASSWSALIGIIGGVWSDFWSALTTKPLALDFSGAIAGGAINSLGQMTTGFFAATADGLAKFAAGLFTADATGRGKFADGIWTNAKIADLDAGKINAGYLSADRIATGSIDAKIATITNAQISSLDAGKINTGYLSAARLDTTVAYISQTAMIASLVVDNINIKNNVIEFAKTSPSFSKDTFLSKTSILVGVDALLGYTTYGYVASAHGSFTLKKSRVWAQIFGGVGTEISYIWGYKIQSASTNPRVKFIIKTGNMATSADRAIIGLKEVDDDGTLHGNGVFVKFERQADSTLQLFGVVEDAYGAHSVTLQTFTIATEYTIEIKLTSGTSATFLVNGVEKGTVTGYYPTGTLCDFYLEIAAHSTNLVYAEIKKWKLTDDW
jgi:phage-related protein